MRGVDPRAGERRWGTRPSRSTYKVLARQNGRPAGVRASSAKKAATAAIVVTEPATGSRDRPGHVATARHHRDEDHEREGVDAT